MEFNNTELMLIRMCVLWQSTGYMIQDREIHDWWESFKAQNPNWRYTVYKENHYV